MHIYFDPNSKADFINITTFDTAPPLHNSHILLGISPDAPINLDTLYAQIRAIPGISDAKPFDTNSPIVNIGTLAPTNPLEVTREILGVLQQNGLITEEDVRNTYKELGLPNRTNPSRDTNQPPAPGR